MLQTLHTEPPPAGCAVSAGSKLFNMLYDKGFSAPFCPKHCNVSHCSAWQTAPLASHDAVICEALREAILMAVKVLQHSMYLHSSCEWCHPPRQFWARCWKYQGAHQVGSWQTNHEGVQRDDRDCSC